MQILTEDILKLLLAILVGGLIGVEREFHNKAAGFRTNIFICVGAALFTILSAKIGGDNDPARIAANIITGVGFIGAGVIMRDSGRIIGLTTAAIIWLVAALGMGIGAGHYALVAAATLFMMVVLWIFPVFESWIDGMQHACCYELTYSNEEGKFEEFIQLFKDCHLKIAKSARGKAGGMQLLTIEVYGTPRAHEQVTKKLLERADVSEVHV